MAVLARPTLPLLIPEPVAIGNPASDYPWPFEVHRWIEGEPLGTVELCESVDGAERLGAFVNARHALPLPGPDAQRSVKAIGRTAWDGFFREANKGVADIMDTA